MTPYVENSPKPFVPPFITGLFQVFGVFLLIAALIFALSGNIAVAIACFVAVIFDLDGTLVDSNELHVESWARAFRHFGKTFPRDELRKQIGEGSDQYLPE